jgi:uncharacterized protein (TIGR04255 family)
MPDAFPHLKRAPITEALLDIQAELHPDGLSEAALAEFRARVSTAFPEERPMHHLQLRVEVGEPGKADAATSQHTVGRIFWSTNHKRAVQARPNGFSVNHVGDYTEWADLKADAERYWADYLAIAHPVRVVRCAVRFINRIDVLTGDDLSKHLRTRPELGDELPSHMEDYFMRIVIPFPPNRRAAITQATLPIETGGTSGKRSLLLDIDAFVETSLAPEAPELWQEFEELRIVKNRCFFQSLQPETWEAYQ